MISRKPVVQFDGDFDDLTLEDVRRFFKAYGRVILSSIVFFLILATLFSLIAKRRYGATAVLDVQKSEISALDALGNATGGPQAAAPADAVEFAVSQPTQVSILESDTLALQVIRELDLEPTADYFPKQEGGFEIPQWLTPWEKPLEPLSVPLDQAPNRRAKALKIFAKRLKVKQQTGTRLISVTYYNPDPRVAAEVVNHLANAYINFEFEARLNQTNQASGWLSSRIKELKNQTEELENNAIKLQRETGLYGADDIHNIVLARLEALNAEETAAESNKILKGAIYDSVRTGNAELISGLNGNSLNGATALNQNSLTLIANLRLQEAALKPQLADYSTRYGSKHPKLIELRAQIDSIEAAINQEIARIAERAKSDYEIADTTERESKKNLDAQRTLANDLKDKATAFQVAKQEADDSRALYGNLLAKLTEAGILQGLKASNVAIVDPGRIPPTNDPAKPNLLLVFGAAAGVGLVLGCILALWAYLLDTRYQSLEETEQISDIFLAGVLPNCSLVNGGWWRRFKRFVGLRVGPIPDIDCESVLQENPWYLEAMLALRTSILFPGPSGVPQVIVTSNQSQIKANAPVGWNLATLLASTGARTLWVDANIRDGASLSSSKPSTLGLSEVLSSPNTPSQDYLVQKSSNLYYVAAGRAAAFNALSLLGSVRMKELIAEWRSQFRFIVIDVPAQHNASDAAIAGTFADLFLLIVRQRATLRQRLHVTLARLREVLSEKSQLGIVFTGVDKESLEHFEYCKEINKSGGRGTGPLTHVIETAIVLFVILMGSAAGAQTKPVYTQVGWISPTTQTSTPAPTPSQSAALPQPVPGQETLIIGRGDLISINVYGEPDLNQQVLVNDEGNVPLIMGGSVHVAGFTPAQASAAISDYLRDAQVMLNARVTVIIFQYATLGITVNGEVIRPGVVALTTPRRVVDVIALSGGFTPIADRHTVTIQHGGNVSDQETVFLSNDPKLSANGNNAIVKPGDTILVPRAPVIYVNGNVSKPGAYVMQYESRMTVLQALSFAGSELPDSKRGSVRLIRKTDGKYTEVAVHLNDIEKGKAVDLELLPDDVLYVPFSLGRHVLLGVGSLLPAAETSAVYAAAP